MFVGREEEIKVLKNRLKSKKAELIIIYGRRRVGKSKLIEEVALLVDSLLFEAIENGRIKDQLAHFKDQLLQYVSNPLLEKTEFQRWQDPLDLLTDYLSKSKKTVLIVFDELQWMVAGRAGLISLIKYYWDRHWKKMNCKLILCGSIASFMIKKVINSKALYGRATLELHLREFTPYEASLLLKQRNCHEVLKFMLTVGGIPKYLEEVNTSMSFSMNMNNLYFNRNALLKDEYQRIFYSQFTEVEVYKKIAKLLSDRPYSLDEISKKINFSSGGGLKSYVVNLCAANFTKEFTPYGKGINSKLKKYRLVDPFLRFYFKYVEPNKKLIMETSKRNLFTTQIEPKWSSWMGIAFENFCYLNIEIIADKMGFLDKLITFGPLYSRKDDCFQVDLIFKRSDKVITLCEIKYVEAPLTSKIIAEVEKKCSLINIPRGYTLEKAIIAPFGVNQSVHDSEYFHHVLSVEDIFFSGL